MADNYNNTQGTQQNQQAGAKGNVNDKSQQNLKDKNNNISGGAPKKASDANDVNRQQRQPE